MSKDIKLDANGDMVREHGVVQWVYNEEQIAQSARIILATAEGEFELAPEAGLNRDNLLGKNLNQEYLAQDITDALTEQDPRIITVDSIDFVQTERNLKIELEMTADLDGATETIGTEVAVDA